jgi:hypothetical protein
MADLTIAKGDTGVTLTLEANVVSTITFAENIGQAACITDGTAPVVWTTDGTTPTNPPNGSSRNGHRLPAIAAVDVRDTNNTGAGFDVVKVLSSGTPTVTVEKA